MCIRIKFYRFGGVFQHICLTFYATFRSIIRIGRLMFFTFAIYGVRKEVIMKTLYFDRGFFSLKNVSDISFPLHKRNIFRCEAVEGIDQAVILHHFSKSDLFRPD